jgi:hypothetical protein
MQWRSKSKNWPVQQGSTRDVVDCFLEIHAYWFDMPGNAFCDRRNSCLRILIEFVEQNKQPPFNSSIQYLIDKFVSEYFSDYELVPGSEASLDPATTVPNPSQN